MIKARTCVRFCLVLGLNVGLVPNTSRSPILGPSSKEWLPGLEARGSEAEKKTQLKTSSLNLFRVYLEADTRVSL